jgi:hypothetical protein
MNRRTVLLTGASAIGLLPFTQSAFAEGQACAEIPVTSEISANHGHSLLITSLETLRALRATLVQPELSLSIQGAARHEHLLILKHEDLLKLFVEGEILIPSSQDLGHSHTVTLRMIAT